MPGLTCSLHTLLTLALPQCMTRLAALPTPWCAHGCVQHRAACAARKAHPSYPAYTRWAAAGCGKGVGGGSCRHLTAELLLLGFLMLMAAVCVRVLRGP